MCCCCDKCALEHLLRVSIKTLRAAPTHKFGRNEICSGVPRGYANTCRMHASSTYAGTLRPQTAAATLVTIPGTAPHHTAVSPSTPFAFHSHWQQQHDDDDDVAHTQKLPPQQQSSRRQPAAACVTASPSSSAAATAAVPDRCCSTSPTAVAASAAAIAASVSATAIG